MKCHYCQSESNNLSAFVLREPKPGKPERIYVCTNRRIVTDFAAIVLPNKNCYRWAKADGYEREEKDGFDGA
jgi:hypothetical protein